MMIVWVFSGEKESRKNYFRAIFAWLIIVIALGGELALLGNLPGIEKQMHSWTYKQRH
jgi:hypothetical protein